MEHVHPRKNPLSGQKYLPGMEPLTTEAHYNSDILGEMPGAGPMALITKDHLHPPMVDDESIWADGHRWHEGAIQHTLEAAALCKLSKNQRLFDVGCGVCGPARTLVDTYSVNVIAITNAALMADTAWKINATRPSWMKRITVKVHDCQNKYRWRGFDCAWSMNMIYHVQNKAAMLSNIKTSLRSGGRLMIDDWMLTSRATDTDVNVLGQRFVGTHFARRDELIPKIAQMGFVIHEVHDLGHIGRTWLAKHFHEQYERCFRSSVEKQYNAEAAQQVADHIGFTIQMYAEEKMTWCRIIAVKP